MLSLTGGSTVLEHALYARRYPKPKSEKTIRGLGDELGRARRSWTIPEPKLYSCNLCWTPGASAEDPPSSQSVNRSVDKRS